MAPTLSTKASDVYCSDWNWETAMLDHQGRLASFCWKSALDILGRSDWLDDKVCLYRFVSYARAESVGWVSALGVLTNL